MKLHQRSTGINTVNGSRSPLAVAPCRNVNRCHVVRALKDPQQTEAEKKKAPATAPAKGTEPKKEEAPQASRLSRSACTACSDQCTTNPLRMLLHTSSHNPAPMQLPHLIPLYVAHTLSIPVHAALPPASHLKATTLPAGRHSPSCGMAWWITSVMCTATWGACSHPCLSTPHWTA